MEPDHIEIKQAPEREAVSLTAESNREKKDKAHQANAEKQRRYRQSMKTQGCKVAIEGVLEEICRIFSEDCEKRGITREEWEPVYRDLQALLKPLGGGK